MAATRQAAQSGEQLGPLGSVVPDEHREPGGGRPEPVAPAEQGAERLAQLLRAVRLGREQRQLPSVDGLAQTFVEVGRGEPFEEVGREPGPELVQPSWLPRGSVAAIGSTGRTP